MSLEGTKLATDTATVATQLLNAAGEGIATRFRATITDSVDRVHLYCSAVTGTPPTYAVRIETVDANGLPTGTLAGGSAQETFTPTAATYHSITLSTPAALTAGTHYAAIVTNDGVTAPDGSNNATFLYRSAGLYASMSPMAMTDTGSGWVVSVVANTWPAVMPQYDSTTDRMFQGVTVAASSTTVSYGSGSTPDEIGILFTVPFTMDLSGVAFSFRLNATSADFDVSLYSGDASGDTDLVERLSTYDAGWMVTGALGFIAEFPAVHTLASGTNHRLTVTPTTTNALRLSRTVFGSAALLQAVFGASHHECSRTDAGSWTDSTAQVIHMVPLLQNYVAGGAAVAHLAGNCGGLVG